MPRGLQAPIRLPNTPLMHRFPNPIMENGDYTFLPSAASNVPWSVG
jgi:hypothetical protein